MLCVSYKILERLINSCVEPNIDSLLSIEQVGFPRGKSTVDQILLLTENIEDFFVDLLIEWRYMTLSGTVILPVNCFRLLLDKEMVMELARNQSFTFNTGDNKQSKFLRPKNSVFLFYSTFICTTSPPRFPKNYRRMRPADGICAARGTILHKSCRLQAAANFFFWRTLRFWDENRNFGDGFQLKTFFFLENTLSLGQT